MRTLVVGDIHGADKALAQCLERSAFREGVDRLISLGDVCDGYPDVRACVDRLMALPNCDFILGNHDYWTREWARTGSQPEAWLEQGGDNTVLSYGGGPIPESHRLFFENAKTYITLGRKWFVHGGIDPALPIEGQDEEVLLWDRSLIRTAYRDHLKQIEQKAGGYDEIYLGHTPTQYFGFMTPVRFGKVWAMDTGAGWSGMLTVMDVDTKEYWQSDPTPVLYPGIRPRRQS